MDTRQDAGGPARAGTVQEYFDMLDCTGAKTGEIIARDKAHRIGAWHGAFHCLIFYERNNTPHALFQKRSMSKKVAPGRYDVSVGGHYASGEDAKTAGPREIKEELGIDVKFEELLPIGRRVCVYCFTPGVLEYEFQDVFLLPYPVRLSELLLQQEELDCVIEMDIDLGIKLFTGEKLNIECSLSRRGETEECVQVSATEFVPCLDNYYLKLLLLARRYLKGERKMLVI